MQTIVLTIVAVVFAVAAAFLLWVLGAMYADHQSAKGWIPVAATVVNAEVKSSSATSIRRYGGAIINSRISAGFRYRFGSSDYTGDRVDFSFGSDSFSGQRRARQMGLLHGGNVTVYVNPEDPRESVLDRSLPVEQVNFAVIFLLFPCGVGTAVAFGWLSHLASKVGWEWPTRMCLPFLGLLHSLPALYAPIFAPAEIGFFGWILVLCAVVLLVVSVRAFWRRIQNPDLDSPQWTLRQLRSSSYSGRKHERE